MLEGFVVIAMKVVRSPGGMMCLQQKTGIAKLCGDLQALMGKRQTLLILHPIQRDLVQTPYDSKQIGIVLNPTT